MTPHLLPENMEAAMRIAENDPYGVGVIFHDKDRSHYQDVLRTLNKDH